MADEEADVEEADVEVADVEVADVEVADVEVADVEVADVEVADVEVADVEVALEQVEELDASSEEEDDEEEVEPSLKYERSIKSDLRDRIFPNTKISIISVHEKFIVLGDVHGQVFLLDHSGNIIRQINAHKGPVTCISIDSTGEYIASCSRHDPNVIIKGLYKESSERDSSESFRAAVYSVELGPDFATQGHYVVGTDRLMFNEKGFFGVKRSVLHAGEGPIWKVSWKKTFIAWANDMGVKIFDTNSRKLITKIARDPKSPSPADYQCHLCWYNGVTLLVGWANTIKICQVRPRTSADSQDLPPFYVEVMNIIYLDHYVSGIGPQPDDKIISLGYRAPENGQPVRPCIRITGFNGEELSLEELSIKGYETCGPNDYNMSVLTYDHFVYICAPTDLVLAKPRDMDDKVEWLKDRLRFDEALEVVRVHENQLRKHTFKSVGQKYLAHLRSVGQFEKCAEACSSILQGDGEAWQQEIMAFTNCKKLTVLCPYIPTKTPVLKPWAYELALSSFLNAHEFELFDKFVRLWPPEIYGQQAVINYLKKMLSEIKLSPADNLSLLKCLGLLYEYQEDFVNSLYLYIKLSDPKAFALIARHNLFASLEGDDKILRLLTLNEEKAIDLYINNTDKIPVSMVVEDLKKRDKKTKSSEVARRTKLLYKYLDSLFQMDPEIGFEHHEDMIGLYAEYDTSPGKSRLMRFLRESTSYPIDKAYEICEKRRLYEAQVYLLTQMGRPIQALVLLVDEIGDITAAIEFCKEQDDKELWDSLLKKATKSKKSSYITGLLQNIGTHINPKDLIAQIPNGQKIDGLRDSLVKILCDYKLQIHLNEGCKRVFVNDTVSLSRKMRGLARRGTHVDEENNCQICKNMVISYRDSSDVTVFFCGHVFHNEPCLERSGKNYCISCHK